MDTETLRKAALAASWRRDRSVGSRRLALRWFGWFGLRFGLPIAIGLGLLWLAQQPLPEPPAPDVQPIHLKPAPSQSNKESQ